MINQTCIIGLDGHDGAGKSTLASELGRSFNTEPVTPFSGSTGTQLLEAASVKDFDRTMQIGDNALRSAISNYNDAVLILDRSWMTVASLLPWRSFEAAWTTWIPTVLCWSDLETTLDRLEKRDEELESVDSHQYYLDYYLSIANEKKVPVLRTDKLSISECLEYLSHAITEQTVSALSR